MYPSEKDKQYFLGLLSKYNNGTATASETEFVERFIAIMDYRRSDAMAGFEEQKGAIGNEIETRLLDSIRQDAGDPVSHSLVHRIHFLRRYGRWAAAAVFIVLASGGLY